MKSLKINNNFVSPEYVKSQDYAKKSSIIQNRKAHSKIEKTKLEEVFIFSCSNIKLALRLTNVGLISNVHSSIFKTNFSNKAIFGFSFINNKLVNIIDINYLINIPISNNNKQILEIFRGKTRIGIQIDTNNCTVKKIEIPFSNSFNTNYRYIEKVINLNDEPVFLIDESLLFSTISKYVYIK